MLALLAAAVTLFWIEKIPADLVALGLLLALVLTRLLPADQAFAGFASDTVMTMLGLLIMTAALMRTGFVDIVGRAILRRAGESPRRLMAIVMVATAGLSAFISNTAATAFFLPTVLGVARRARISPSRLLMPLAFSSIVTSSVTLVSTSTNLVVSGLMQQSGMAPFGMFELAPVGIPISIAGLLYIFFVGPLLIPERAPAEGETDNSSLSSPLKAYLTELVVLEGSRLAGKTIGESGLGRDFRVTVLGVEREGMRRLMPSADTQLMAGDVLLVEGEAQDLATITADAGIEVRHDAAVSDADLEDADVKLAEAIVMPGSQLIGRRLRHLDLRIRFGVQVLAIRREGRTLYRGVADERLMVGDLLLTQGEPARIRALGEAETLRVAGIAAEGRPNLKRVRIAALAFGGALLLASLKLLPFPVAILLGALVVMATRCITPDEAYREVHWRSLVLIACMLGVGRAMETTGAASYLADHIAAVAGTGSPVVLMAGVFILTVLLTQPLSNQAAAALVVPVAFGLARHLDLDPRAFAVTVAVAASCSYLTPLEPSCLMVHGPGRYRFSDFIKVGALLTVIIFVIAMLIIPRLWKP